MLIGLDVGGTHTDAVLLEADSGKIRAFAKTGTRRDAVLPGVLEALGAVLRDCDAGRVRRVCVSTTLGLNALLTGGHDAVGLLAASGPGIDPQLFLHADGEVEQELPGPAPQFQVVRGCQDHRGRIVEELDPKEVRSALERMLEHKARAFALVSKFSPKNPELERQMAALAREVFAARDAAVALPEEAEDGDGIPVILGASGGGSLNFPRRLHTAWCNAALARLNRAFIRSLKEAAGAMGLLCPLVVLKADAGAFSAEEAALDAASAMGSGPAASLLGVWALCSAPAGSFSAGKEEKPSRTLAGALARPSFDLAGDILMIDMGGTSTDLALLAGGYPLLAAQGLRVGGRATLIRGLWTRSLALGGDSCLSVASGSLCIGPDRARGALYGESPHIGEISAHPPVLPSPPTLTDALNALGLAGLGNEPASRAALAALAQEPDSPEKDPLALARLFIKAALLRIREASAALVEEVNARPVYTIRELLVRASLSPGGAVLIGGPAAALAGFVEAELGLPVFVPEQSAFANALGAALARPTRSARLYADTLLGRMSLPDFDLERRIDKNYSLEMAKLDMREAFLAAQARDEGTRELEEPQIVEAESFVMLDEAGARGRVIRLRAQQPAGLLPLPCFS